MCPLPCFLPGRQRLLPPLAWGDPCPRALCTLRIPCTLGPEGSSFLFHPAALSGRRSPTRPAAVPYSVGALLHPEFAVAASDIEKQLTCHQVPSALPSLASSLGTGSSPSQKLHTRSMQPSLCWPACNRVGLVEYEHRLGKVQLYRQKRPCHRKIWITFYIDSIHHHQSLAYIRCMCRNESFSRSDPPSIGTPPWTRASRCQARDSAAKISQFLLATPDNATDSPVLRELTLCGHRRHISIL
jgi:hypothetical protein